MRAAPEDRMLSDDEWAAVANDVMDRTGLSPYGQEDEAVRWVAVRHGDDHIHIVAMLARQDGGKPGLSWERVKVRAACLAADPSRQVLDMITDATASLSAGNARAFLANFDPAMPNYQKLRDNVTTLLSQAEVESFVDVANDEGDAQRRTVELNWRMRIRQNRAATAAPGREQII